MSVCTCMNIHKLCNVKVSLKFKTNNEWIKKAGQETLHAEKIYIDNVKMSLPPSCLCCRFCFNSLDNNTDFVSVFKNRFVCVCVCSGTLIGIKRKRNQKNLSSKYFSCSFYLIFIFISVKQFIYVSVASSVVHCTFCIL